MSLSASSSGSRVISCASTPDSGTEGHGEMEAVTASASASAAEDDGRSESSLKADELKADEGDNQIPSEMASSLVSSETDEEVDRFGFFLSSDRPSKLQAEEVLKKEAEREIKWRKMLDRWEFTLEHRTKKLKRRIRKGIPNSLREEAWPLLIGSKAMMAANGGHYRSLLQSDMTVDGPIEEDLPRTMYDNQRFRQQSSSAASEGRESLRNVLLAYGRHDREAQYCQGMNYIAALFLLYLPEEDAFWMLVAVMQRKGAPMREFFLPGMSKAQELLFVLNGLCRKFVPRLSRRIESFGLMPSMYAHPWFITCFTQRFPYDLVTRVWDAFLFEDFKVIYRVCLALFKQAEAEGIATLDLEAMNLAMRSLPTRVDVDAVMTLAWEIPLKHRHVDQLMSKYEKV